MYLKMNLSILFAAWISVSTFAQKQRYIILRHAEKDTTAVDAKMMQSDPPLNINGKNRASNLIHEFKLLKINKIFSTNYNRTKSTVTPLANSLNLDIQIYDPRQLKDFATQLLAMPKQDHTYLIVGHSNTSPRLVNLLTGKATYKDLDETEYNKYWIVTKRNNKIRAKMKHY